MNFQQFLLILLARRRVVLYTTAATVATTLIVSLLLPSQYTAGTAVVVDVKSPDPVMGTVLPGLISPGYMATQIDIIQSDKVAYRVIKMLKLDENPTAREQWQDDTDGRGSIEAYLAGLLKKKLDVKPSRESNVIAISYTATEPKLPVSWRMPSPKPTSRPTSTCAPSRPNSTPPGSSPAPSNCATSSKPPRPSSPPTSAKRASSPSMSGSTSKAPASPNSPPSSSSRRASAPKAARGKARRAATPPPCPKSCKTRSCRASRPTSPARSQAR